MRYFTALNIKDTDAYKSINARLVYLHMLCSMNYETREYKCSTRGIGAELGITRKAAVCAIDALTAVGLIRCQEGCQARSQAITYIINDLSYYKEPRKEPTKGTTLLDNNNNNISLTCVRERFLSSPYLAKACEYWGVECSEGENWVTAFVVAQELRQREHWDNEGDAWRHLLDWVDKKKQSRGRRVVAPPPPSPPPSAEEPTAVQEPTPSGWSSEDWTGIRRLVESGAAAPPVIELYNQTLKNWQNENN